MSPYKKKACDVVLFRLIYGKENLEAENNDGLVTFKPEMSHQIFGDSEGIFGYKNLQITINMIHNSCRCYLDIESSGKVRKKDVKADDIIKSLHPFLPLNYTLSYDDFVLWLEDEEDDKIYGKYMYSFKDSNNTTMKWFPNDNIVPEYRVTLNNTQNNEFREFHARFQTFIMWFIDAANFIQLDDERWIIFYVYEEFLHPVKKKIFRTPIAFCSVYRFYAYPSNVRPRISQFFVLPSHQKRGIGTALFETVAKFLRRQDEVIDFSVEAPTMAFRKMRDLEDCAVVHGALIELNCDFFKINSKSIFDIGLRCKINRKQMQRVYDILGLYYTSLTGHIPYRKFIIYIKNRIMAASERESRPGKMFCNSEREAIASGSQEQSDVDYKTYLGDIEASMEYFKTHLNSWRQRRGLV
ncbi:hypothetical protein ABEB36_007886 [Hypothenemus hampei]